ncbi:MAG: hypothetical protein AB7P21_05855 [Lautropia sp.]
MSRRLIDALSAEKLLRDLDACAGVTMRRVLTDARDHVWLLERIRAVDVRTDVEFQRQLCRHAGMRGKLRMRRDELFALLETLRDAGESTYPDLLMKVSELTGQVEKSVASEILALLDPQQPTIDREVRELLPRYGFYPLPESPLFDECVAYHASLRDLMVQLLAMPAFERLESRLDTALGPAAARLSSLRKLNLLLSGSFRTVALMPNMDAVRKALPRRVDLTADPAAGGSATSTVRQGVRLHLCR